MRYPSKDVAEGCVEIHGAEKERASVERKRIQGKEGGQSTEVWGMIEFRMIQTTGSRQRNKEIIHSVLELALAPGPWDSSCSEMTFRK